MVIPPSNIKRFVVISVHIDWGRIVEIDNSTLFGRTENDPKEVQAVATTRLQHNYACGRKKSD
jgi:hypothetical protein